MVHTSIKGLIISKPKDRKQKNLLLTDSRNQWKGTQRKQGLTLKVC